MALRDKRNRPVVAVTGMGVVSSLGTGLEENWEALVAGRHVVLPDCAANRPYLGYPNANAYRDTDGAIAALERALATPPEAPLAGRRDYDWHAACRSVLELLEMEPAARFTPRADSRPESGGPDA